MAKLKAPLFSLGASGAIGEALVYFGWKGLNVVREYVVPSNPRTSAQTTQRGYLTEAVDAVHEAQAAGQPLTADDITAYGLWASVVKAATTWFNQVVRNWIDQQVKATGISAIFCYGRTTPASGQITFFLNCRESASLITTIDVFYGTSKTALVHSVSTTRTLLMAGKAITGLTNGTKYYMQARPTAPAGFVGCRSGIYYDTPAA